MLRCHLSTLMGRDKLRISDVARLTGLNRSTIAALSRETATRVDLSMIKGPVQAVPPQRGRVAGARSSRRPDTPPPAVARDIAALRAHLDQAANLFCTVVRYRDHVMLANAGSHDRLSTSSQQADSTVAISAVVY